MKRSVLAAMVVTSAAALAAATHFIAASAAAPSAEHERDDLVQRDVQITVWRKALAMDSSSAIATGQLAGLYMQRGRESGDESNYSEAERFARMSVGERTNRNGAAFVTLSTALLAQHRFVEAGAVSEELVALEPDVPEYRALRGEIQLELGDYDGARASFASLAKYQRHLSIAPRLARWRELSGDTRGARLILRNAASEAAQRRDIPREQLAWFYLRSGDIDLRNGRLRGAAAGFRSGLAAHPDDHRLLAAMARLEAMRDRPRSAIQYGERAMSIKLDPATLGSLSEAYAAVGDSTRAREYERVMELSVASQPGAYHRAWSLFLLDHDQRVGEVLEKASAELRTRRDVYGYDIVAWALFKSGRVLEARNSMRHALRMNTRDAQLYFHAGVIELAAGDTVAARRHLEGALAINPRFHPLQRHEAERALRAISR